MKNLFICSLIFAFSVGCSLRDKTPPKKTYEPKVLTGFFGEAERNGDWKDAALTAKNAQVVFMSISPETNPKNEIGMEVHPFDQVIYIVDGWARAILDDQTEMVQGGDMILVPAGTKHNVMNLNKQNPLKVVSFYTDRDIPEGAVYRTKADEMAQNESP